MDKNQIISGILYFAYYVLGVIGQWKLFTKSGQAGWKALIPVYRVYTLFKVSWVTTPFWLFILNTFVGTFCIKFALEHKPFSVVILAIGIIAICVATVSHIMQCKKLAVAFGKGAGFAVGLIFFEPIFWLILGYGKSQYIKLKK